jgi:hypothetical protein
VWVVAMNITLLAIVMMALLITIVAEAGAAAGVVEQIEGEAVPVFNLLKPSGNFTYDQVQH